LFELRSRVSTFGHTSPLYLSTAVDNPAVGVLPSCAGAAVIGGDAGVDSDSDHADIMGI
jgi:hypothetical protein